MKSELYSTQVEDVAKLVGGDDVPNYSKPGTGKTLTTIGAIEKMGLQRGLIVCPTIATQMWIKNLERELGCRVQWLKTRKTRIDKKADFLVASYGVLEGHAHSLLSRENDALVIDEAHYLKSSDSQRTQLIFGESCDGVGGVYETSQYCFSLTGTPIERYADDLWSQLRATHPSVLQRFSALTLDAFQQQFCRMMEKEYAGGRVTKWVSVDNQNELLLKNMIYKQIGALRRTLKDVKPDMPPVLYRNIFIKSKVTHELRAALKGMSLHDIEEALLEGGSMITSVWRLVGLSKINGVVDYIKEVVKDEPLIVGYWHTEVGDAIMEALNTAKLSAQRIGGGTLPTRRERIKESFMIGETEVIVGQIAALGVSMDGLQVAGRRIFLAEDEWSAAKVEQFYGRLYRNGQTMPVQVDFAHSDSPVDDAIENIRLRKEQGAMKILD